jgi:UDPglucose--hexose-1-phosphate uridylyltransferase
MNLSDYPHRRFNPLLGEWLLVSPHRTKRPWQGKVEKSPGAVLPSFDPACYLCPGNIRADGSKNPNYSSTHVFTNDFSALIPTIPSDGMSEKNLLVAKSERGLCKVICFSPQHNLTLALMAPEDLRSVVGVWIEQYQELGSLPYINHVQIFENRGDVMGCSNQHPHGQIWANETVPILPAAEGVKQKEYLEKNNTCLLCDYVNLEKNMRARIVLENDTFVALVPFWAIWPFETMIIPKTHMTDISMLSETQKLHLAEIMRGLGIRYDNLFQTSFPYSMGIHQKPTDNQPHLEWHFHVHYYPPLLRSALVRKFMVGYEMLAMPQRDITAEESARRLRACSAVHYAKQ